MPWFNMVFKVSLSLRWIQSTTKAIRAFTFCKKEKADVLRKFMIKKKLEKRRNTE